MAQFRQRFGKLDENRNVEMITEQLHRYACGGCKIRWSVWGKPGDPPPMDCPNCNAPWEDWLNMRKVNGKWEMVR